MIKLANSIRTGAVTLTVVCLVLSSDMAAGQPFFLVGNDLADAGRSAVNWADYDNDGDLDLLVSGLGPNDQLFTKVYANNEGSFELSSMVIEGYKETSANWGDMDGDGDLDLLIAGNTVSGDKTRIYRNDSGVLVETDPGVLAIQNGEACWMDFDNDGDLDIFLTGNWSARIYENRQGNFEYFPQDFGLFSSSAADWGDFDNDGDLDLLILGDSGAGAVSMIFRNDYGNFISVDAGLTGLMAGSADWVDYDNDGDLDVAIAGNDDALESQFFLYRNDGRGDFTYISTGIEGFALGDADWGDFDNDGDLDLLYSGKCPSCGVNVGGIYRNDGEQGFFHITGVFNAVLRCALHWADYDNDGDLDFIIAGINDWGQPVTALYQNMSGNNVYSINEAPSAPQSLGAFADGDQVSLSWAGSTDDHTPQDGLSYNIRIGLTPQGNEVVPPLAISGSGFRKVPALGNAGQMNTCWIENLLPGTYYWSVQAIDQAFSGSEFAPEGSFTITATGLDDISTTDRLLVYPSPATSTITISDSYINKYAEMKIVDSSGRCRLTQHIDHSVSIVDISHLAPGFYIVYLSGQGITRTAKLMIN